LTSKGPLSLQGTIGNLGNITRCHFYLFIFFETFCEHAPQNKLDRSTNFITFGPTDQKLLRNENFGKSLGRVGKCWRQPTRLDHMCSKMWVGRRRGNLQGGSYGHLHKGGGRPMVTHWLQFFHLKFIIVLVFRGSLGMGLAFWEDGCTVLPFFEPCPYTWKRWNLPFLMELGDFIKLFLLKLKYNRTFISIVGIFV
jgi:hypothetical protein